jgi:hypothetical protein
MDLGKVHFMIGYYVCMKIEIVSQLLVKVAHIEF